MAVTTAGVITRRREYTGLLNWLTTVDHKRIGTLYAVSSFFFLLVGGIEALIMRLQLAGPGNTVVDPDTYNQLFTMHGTTMVFMVVMPMSAAFFNWLVPLMIGARDVAFPRLNALSFWLFLFGSVLMYSSFFVARMPNAGWFGYANLTSREFSPGHAVDFWAAGLLVLGVSSTASALNFIVTILNLRAPGMTMMRLPVFAWMTLFTAILIALAMPVIGVALIFLLFDRLFGTHFYDPSMGGTPLLWQHLFWIFGHPEVYILILPAMGIVSEVIPTFSRKPLFGYPAIVIAGAAIAFLGFAVWAHHMFTVGGGPVMNFAFSLSTMLIAIPTGVKIFNWLGTMWGGSIRWTTPMLFAVGFVTMFVVGGISGIMHASVPVDYQQQDSYFVVAHFHYVLFGGAVLGLFAGLYYWIPKVTGRVMSERLGRLNFWLMLIGFNVTFFPMHFLGLFGMPRRIYTYSADMGWNAWNLVITIGAFITALSVLVFIYNFAVSMRRGRRAGNDPWDARTLEWAIPSPPPEYNFAVTPLVRARDEWWHRKRLARTGRHTEDPDTGEDPESHLPNPSYWPIVLSAGIAIAAGGLIFVQDSMLIGRSILALGLAITVGSIYAWVLEPLFPRGEHH